MQQVLQKWNNEDAAFRQLVGKLSMEQVKPFMCPESKGNTTRCMNCDDFKVCMAGQRAVRLMSEAAQAERQEEQKKIVDTPPVNISADREEFTRACESGNAWGFLMTERRMSENAARLKLEYWISHYPNITREFGGRKRILAKPKAVKIVRIAEDVPTASQDAQEQAPVVPEVLAEAAEEKEPEKAGNVRKTDAAISERIRALHENARKRCEDAVASGDVRQYLMNEGRSEHNVTNTISRWRQEYPELMADVPRMKRGGSRKKKEEPPEDEVTLEEFLSEFDEAEADRIEADLQPEEFRVEEQPQETQKQAGNGDPMLKMMIAKHEELKAEKRRLEERIRCIEEQQKALEQTLSAFGSKAPWE